ncbi:MAG: hypothetical protein ACF8R9_05585 [Phycisphaerales bacterium JB054]
MAARTLSRRLARLEGERDRVCTACGWGAETVVYDVVVPVAVGSVLDLPEPPEPRRCPRCGRPTEYHIAFPTAREQ